MSDLFGNHIVGFPTRRLIYISSISSDFTPTRAQTLVELFFLTFLTDRGETGGVFHPMELKSAIAMVVLLCSFGFQQAPVQSNGSKAGMRSKRLCLSTVYSRAKFLFQS